MTTSYFFFAHQDDEFGVFHVLEKAVINNESVHCIYMTDGAVGEATSEKRNRESASVLKQLGISEKNIYFLGLDLKIKDGQLPYSMAKALNHLDEIFNGIDTPVKIYIPAWEGGHPDHDALHALVTIYGDRNNIINSIFQFPLYNNYRCIWKFFKVLSPLKLNGEIKNEKIRHLQKIQYLRNCLIYRSQKKTWLGLLPFAAWHYFSKGTQSLQRVSLRRVYQRPHEGPLYYEVRKWITWEKMMVLINKL